MQAILPAPHRKARIEIIPLIDIMFFLLASFMLVSLTMIRLQGLHVALPSKLTQPIRETSRPNEVLRLEVGPNGELILDRQTMTGDALVEALTKRKAADELEAQETKLFITVNEAAKHSMLVEALDRVKQAGISKFGFSLKPSRPVRPPSPASPGA